MDEFAQKLEQIIKRQGVDAKLLVFQTSCHSVAEAAASANAKPEDFVKNVCAISERDGGLVVAIIGGTARLDFKKLSKQDGGGKFRLATGQEMLEKTGFPAGGTPSFGYPARFYLDQRALEKENVWSGGGSPNALTSLSPREILRASGAKPADLIKE